MAYCVDSEDAVNKVEIENFDEENCVTSFSNENCQGSMSQLKFGSL